MTHIYFELLGASHLGSSPGYSSPKTTAPRRRTLCCTGLPAPQLQAHPQRPEEKQNLRALQSSQQLLSTEQKYKKPNTAIEPACCTHQNTTLLPQHPHPTTPSQPSPGEQNSNSLPSTPDEPRARASHQQFRAKAAAQHALCRAGTSR